MDNSQLSDLRIEQTMVNGGTVFKDREFRRNILGVGKDKVLFCFVFISIFELGGSVGHPGSDVQNSECSTEIEAEMPEGS